MLQPGGLPPGGPEHAERLAEVVQIIARLPLTGLRVLLAGVSEYQNGELPVVQGALNDVAGIARL